MATNVRDINSVRGTVLDLPDLMSLQSDDANLLCVSTRTLAIIQAYSRLEVSIQARYARQILSGNQYVIADEPDELDDIEVVSNAFQLEVIDVTCDIVEAINGLTAVLQQTRQDCGCNVGEGPDNEAGESGGSVPGDVGSIVYSEPVAITDRKCKVSNLTFETLLNIFQELDDHRVDELGAVGMIAAIGLVSALIASVVATPITGVVVGVAGVLAALVARIIGITIDLGTVVQVLTDNAPALVCSLYSNSSVDDASGAFEAILVADGGLTSAEIATVMLPFTNAWLNTLFFDVEGLSDFLDTYVGPYDCSSCAGTFPVIWSFGSGFEGWTFEDASTPPASASRAFSPGEIVTTLNTNGVDQALGIHTSPSMALSVTTPNAVRADFGASSVPGESCSLTLRLHYTDLTTNATTISVSSTPVTVTTLVLPLKTLERIEIFMSKTDLPTISRSLLEVRVQGS